MTYAALTICPCHLHAHLIPLHLLCLSLLIGLLATRTLSQALALALPSSRISGTHSFTFWSILLNCLIHIGSSLNTSYEAATSDPPIMSNPYQFSFSPLHLFLSDLAYVN